MKIDWEKAGELWSDVQKMYKTIEEFRRLVDRECTLPEPPAPTPVPPEPPVIIPDPPESKMYLRDYVAEWEPRVVEMVLTDMLPEGADYILRNPTTAYNRIYYTHKQIILLCMKLANEKYPRGVNKFVPGDFGSELMTGLHVEHNGRTDVMDIFYCTMSGRNDPARENLWLDTYPYMLMEPGIFDAEKMYYLFSLIKRFFPDARILVSVGIDVALRSQGPSVVISEGDVEGNMHQFHAHLLFGLTIAWGARVKDG